MLKTTLIWQNNCYCDLCIYMSIDLSAVDHSLYYSYS